jgi:hypothetical protein
VPVVTAGVRAAQLNRSATVSAVCRAIGRQVSFSPTTDLPQSDGFLFTQLGSRYERTDES